MERGREWVGKNCLDEELPLLATLQAHAQSTRKNASNTGHMGIPAYARMQKLPTTRKTLMLYVVNNSVKLHITALNNCIANWRLGT